MAKKKKSPKKAAPKKKKAIKKRVISKTEKALKYKRNYQMQLRRIEYKNKDIGINELLNSTSETIGKNIVYLVPEIVKKHLGIEKKNYKATKQTILNAYYNKVYKLSTKVNEIENILVNRFKFKEKKYLKTTKNKKGELTIPLGFIWDIDSTLTGAIFKNKIVKSVDGKDKKTDAPEILNQFNKLKSEIGSNQFVQITGKDGIFKVEVTNEENKKGKNRLKKYANRKTK
jgi:hypothetical protein